MVELLPTHNLYISRASATKYKRKDTDLGLAYGE